MKLLALDIGNVCVRIDFGNFARALAVPEISPELVALQRELECGRITDGEFFAAVAETYSCPVAEAERAFDSILIEPVPGMTELVSALETYGWSARFFSDISPAHLARTKAIFPAAAAVPDGMFSFVSGAQKPTEAMFSAFEKRFGVPQLYVDDRIELIAAARARGWNAIQFTRASELNALLC